MKIRIVPSRVPHPIVDINGYIIGHVASPPNDALYDTETKDLLYNILDESQSNSFSNGELHHKRGDFPAVNFGWTLPNGFQGPINLDDSRHKPKIARICESPGFIKISGHQNGKMLNIFLLNRLLTMPRRCLCFLEPRGL